MIGSKILYYHPITYINISYCNKNNVYPTCNDISYFFFGTLGNNIIN